MLVKGFHDSSVGKESTCTAGDSGLIPGLGRSTGEGISHPLQCSWASLVAQLEKNMPPMREICIWYLGWEDPLEKGKATCREPAWGTLPMAKVMRKEAWHMQRQDWASGVSLEILEHLPQNQSLPTLLLCALTYTSDFTRGCPPPPLSEKELT